MKSGLLTYVLLVYRLGQILDQERSNHCFDLLKMLFYSRSPMYFTTKAYSFVCSTISRALCFNFIFVRNIKCILSDVFARTKKLTARNLFYSLCMDMSLTKTARQFAEDLWWSWYRTALLLILYPGRVS